MIDFVESCCMERIREISCRSTWGIGLTLVRGVVEAHQGCIEVESTANRGTIFTVLLPKDFRRKNPSEV